MTVASCPKCNDPVSLPSGASPEAKVQCPLCKDSFELADVLAGLPPALIVLDDPGVEDLKLAPSDEPVVITPPSDDADTPSFAINASVGSSSVSAPTAEGARARRPAPTAGRRKAKNPVMEVIKIALGGIAGLVIAQLLLWWMPVDGWRRDPFGLGPKVGAFAPWIVPDKFEGTSLPNAANGNETDGTQADGNPNGGRSDSGLPVRSFVDPNAGTPSQRGGSGKQNQGRKRNGGGGVSNAPHVVPMDDLFPEPDEAEPIPSPPNVVVNVETPDIDPFGIGTAPAEVEPVSSDQPSLPSVDLVLPAEADELADSLPEVTLDPTLLMEPEPAPTVDATELQPDSPGGPPIAGSPTVEPVALQTSLQVAETQAASWNAASPQELATAGKPTFTALVELGEKAAYAKTLQPAEANRIRKILNGIANTPAKTALFQRVGRGWLGMSERSSDGIIAIGNVTALNQHDNLHEIVLELATDQTVSVYSLNPPATDIAPGSRLLVLGAIVQDPADRLANYPGDASSIIWQAASVAVPSP